MGLGFVELVEPVQSVVSGKLQISDFKHQTTDFYYPLSASAPLTISRISLVMEDCLALL